MLEEKKGMGPLPRSALLLGVGRTLDLTQMGPCFCVNFDGSLLEPRRGVLRHFGWGGILERGRGLISLW